MITLETISKAIYQTIKKSTSCIPNDLNAAFDDAIQKERSDLAIMALQKTRANFKFARDNDYLACSDTGWPLFYFAIGDKVDLQGGLSGLEDISRAMVAEATKNGFMRATVKHPITGSDPGNNIGSNVPNFTYKLVPGDSIQVTFVAKGGGSECFGGTRYQVVAFADGVLGIEKFIVDSFIEGARGGKICPPSVVGIGIGGTADISAKLAKQAAALRLVGSKHPEPEIAEMEEYVIPRDEHVRNWRRTWRRSLGSCCQHRICLLAYWRYRGLRCAQVVLLLDGLPRSFMLIMPSKQKIRQLV